MTMCPCHECERRYIACHASCEKYAEWLVIHAEEKEKYRKDIAKIEEANSFLSDQGKRARIDTVRKSARKRNQWKD